METVREYDSPIGRLILTADGGGLTGLRFCAGDAGDAPRPPGRENAAVFRPPGRENAAVFRAAERWLDAYFSGQVPRTAVPLHLKGTPFQLEVWALLRTIPYGRTTTYGALARQLAARRGLSRLSARAVGGAVGRNPVSVIVPCHRVIGADGSLTGYSGGLERKLALLTLEKIDLQSTNGS